MKMKNLHEQYSGAKLSLELLQVMRQGDPSFRPMRIAKKENIYVGGSENYIYLIESGQVKVSIQTRDGRTCNLGIYSSDQTFGESSLSVQRNAETTTSLTACVVRRLHVPVLIAALQEKGLLVPFTMHLATKMTEYQRVITDFVTNNSEQRLASTILRLAKSLGTAQDCGRIKICEKISLQDLSEMVGTTRSRVGFFMSGFMRLGMIEDGMDLSLIVNPGRIAAYLEQNGRLKGVQSV